MNLCEICPCWPECKDAGECLIQERNDCAPDSMQHPCSPALEQPPATPVERLHSPVVEVLDELSENISLELRTHGGPMGVPAARFDADSFHVGFQKGLKCAQKMIDEEGSRHRPSERSERRANSIIPRTKVRGNKEESEQ